MVESDQLWFICQIQGKDQIHLQQYWLRLQNPIPPNDGLIYYCRCAYYNKSIFKPIHIKSFKVVFKTEIYK